MPRLRNPAAKKVQLSSRVSPTIASKVEDLAYHRGETTTDVVASVLDEYMRKHWSPALSEWRSTLPHPMSSPDQG